MKQRMQRFRRRQEESLWLRCAWMPLCLFSLLLTGGWFWLMYTGGNYPRRWILPAALFTFGWSLGLTALGALLPRIARRCYLAVLGNTAGRSGAGGPGGVTWRCWVWLSLP